MNEDLYELALQAVTTPSLEAPAALNVLVDTLLERGLINPRRRGMRGMTHGSNEHRKTEQRNAWWRAQAAFEWARASVIRGTSTKEGNG
jgi:hypothetical protein